MGQRYACHVHGTELDGQRFRLSAIDPEEALEEALAFTEPYGDWGVGYHADIVLVDEAEWLSLKERPNA